MRIGIPKETKSGEHRVSLTPKDVAHLIACGHEVLVESGAGRGIQLYDKDYTAVGATCVDTQTAFSADLVVKVKEPNSAECALLTPKQTLFTFLHLAADKSCAINLINSGCTAIGYETIYGNSSLPILLPMSTIAGRLSVQLGARFMEKNQGGRGVLLSGLPGAPPAKVVVVGGGIVGSNAIQMALGLGADVTVVDKDVEKLYMLATTFGSRLQTATDSSLLNLLSTADLVIGAVMVAGARTPLIFHEEHLSNMLPDSVLVDVSIDQGGCSIASKPTTFSSPIFKAHDVIHCCVANLPGAVPLTSSIALSQAVIPYVSAMAEKGISAALKESPGFMAGLQVKAGKITCQELAESLDMTYTAPASLL